MFQFLGGGGGEGVKTELKGTNKTEHLGKKKKTRKKNLCTKLGIFQIIHLNKMTVVGVHITT
jgi:hypothetical protein